MNFFIFYFLSFFLTYLGFFLGKSTLEEHREIKDIVSLFLEILISFYILFLIYLFYNSRNIIIIIIIMIYYLISIFYKNNKNKELLTGFELIIFSYSFLLLNKYYHQYLFMFLIPIIYISMKNSFKKFNLKNENTKLIILLILFLMFDFLFKSFI